MPAKSFAAIAIALMLSSSASVATLQGPVPNELTAIFFADAIVVGTPTGRLMPVDRVVCVQFARERRCREEHRLAYEVSVDAVVVGETLERDVIWVADLNRYKRAVMPLFRDRGADLSQPVPSDDFFLVAYDVVFPASDNSELADSLAFIDAVVSDGSFVTPSSALETYFARHARAR